VNMKLLSRNVALAVLALSMSVVALADPSVKPGVAAPALKVARWMKGTPLKSFEKGKVYVVEFWATWCGPCKQSIPHLTELAKKYKGKATFTGVSVYEKSQGLGDFKNYGDKVEAFVKEWGDKMNYNVCWSGDEAPMEKNWMEAAGQGGIPTAFVVDQTGTIAWIGHPMMGLDEVVGQVINGTFDAKAEADKQQKARDEQAKAIAPINSFMTPLRSGKYDEALAAMDKAFADNPKLEMNYGATKFSALGISGGDYASYGRKLADGIYKDQPMMLNTIAWAIVDDKSKFKSPDIKLAVELGEKCVAATKEGDAMMAFNLDTLAYAYFKDGQLEKAITLQEKALKSADATKDFDAATRKEIADRLEMFKKKKG